MTKLLEAPRPQPQTNLSQTSQWWIPGTQGPYAPKRRTIFFSLSVPITVRLYDETLQKRLNRYFNSLTVFASGDFILQCSSSAKLRECEQTCLIVYCLRTDSVVYVEMLVWSLHQKGLYQTTLSAKKNSSSEGLRSLDPIPSFIIQQNSVIT